MQIFLNDSHCRKDLFPFSHTRHVADFRIGILTIKEKWEAITGKHVLTSIKDNHSSELNINANYLPTQSNYQQILSGTHVADSTDFNIIKYPWHLFQQNEQAIRDDFELITKGRKSYPLSKTNQLLGDGGLFIEEGASVECSMLNTSGGPIYIGKNAVVMEGNMIRGPFSIGEGAVLKMGSRIYGGTTIGPFCTAGGEIKNSILFGYSNKAHDGYLGDSVIGEWCNLGAGTSNSNVRNNAGDVKYSTDEKGNVIGAGLKGGLLMGDYSRSAINTSFNTGTIVGVCCNIFGQELTGKYIANFSWGNEKYELGKALRDIDNWKKMKGSAISEEEKAMLKELYHSNH